MTTPLENIKLGMPMEGEMRSVMGENATLRKITITYQDDDGTCCDVSFLHDSWIEEDESSDNGSYQNKGEKQ